MIRLRNSGKVWKPNIWSTNDGTNSKFWTSGVSNSRVLKFERQDSLTIHRLKLSPPKVRYQIFSKNEKSTFLDSTRGFQTFPAGYIHSLARRIRICSQKWSNPSARRENWDPKRYLFFMFKSDRPVRSMHFSISLNQYLIVTPLGKMKMHVSPRLDQKLS